MSDLADNTRNPEVLRLAKQRRKYQIKTLRMCDCEWPEQTLRNGSGHHPTCPVHVAFMEARK